MALESLIESLPDWQNKTAAEITAALSVPEIEHIDSEPRTYAGIALMLGLPTALAIRNKLSELAADTTLPIEVLSLLSFAHKRLDGDVGLDFSQADVQNALDSLAPLLAPFPISSLKGIGRRQATRWEHDQNPNGRVGQYPPPLQVSAVQSALDALRRRNYLEAIDRRITNAAALMRERAVAFLTDTELASLWSTAWEDAR